MLEPTVISLRRAGSMSLFSVIGKCRKVEEGKWRKKNDGSKAKEGN